jgi:hypothetical protein
VSKEIIMAPSKVDPLFFSMFANGDYDFLYEEGERSRIQEVTEQLPQSRERYRLQDARSYVVIEKISKKSGCVVESNLWPKGATVRSRVNWAFAVKPRNGWSPSTFVSPRTLFLQDPQGPKAA